MAFKLLLFCLIFAPVITAKQNSDPDYDRSMHPMPKSRKIAIADEEENSHIFWHNKAQNSLKSRLNIAQNTKIAKNVILFLGDGMSLPTLAATRVYLGDENSQLSFEKFPHTALSKTYCVDSQISDSACTATAYLTGIKANDGTIGVTGDVKLGDCQAMLNSSNHAKSIAYWSQLSGKSTGLVTTTRVTHASPAGVYANTAHRDWETDNDISAADLDPEACDDIAEQLINGDVGRNLNVILGGGRRGFIPLGQFDEEQTEGYRLEDNLIEIWLETKQNDNKSAKYIWNRTDLVNLDTSTVDYLLGLFDSSHIPYNLDRNPTLDPSLAEMTQVAIEILSKNEQGFFLFVEGGRIDQAHHDAKAHKALDETAEFSKAIELAVNLTSEDDTLIVVTSDHSHTLTFNGYSARGNSIFGLSHELGSDDLPYTILSYANGPGYKAPQGDVRYDLSGDELINPDYQFPGTVPKGSETHGGDDVVIFARGPWSHLFSGVLEQNVIPHFMAYASCVGESETACDSNNSKAMAPVIYLIALAQFMALLLKI